MNKRSLMTSAGVAALVIAGPAFAGAVGEPDRVSGTEKGSALIFSKIEIRWDDAGNVIQDTFVDLTNDLGDDVFVNMYFINGDAPLEATADERSHPGWNWVDNKQEWTANQPAYWSALTGAPGPDGHTLSPFTILDPSADPLMQGRPAMDGSDDRVLRGYIYAFAVDEDCCPVSWNHLKGDVTIVNYAKSTAVEYNAWAFQEIRENYPGNSSGNCSNDEGSAEIELEGSDYVQPYSFLLMDFYAPGSGAFGMGSTIETDLTLHPVSADLRQETDGVIGTKASFVIWNEDETQFTNLHRCIVCWDQTLLSLYTDGGVQNHFLHLQTDKGKARIDGIASILCSSDCCMDRGSAAGCEDSECQEQVCEVRPDCCDVQWEEDCAEIAVDICDECDAMQDDAALLGIAIKEISLGGTFAAGALNLIGMGYEDAEIEYDPAPGSGNPPTATGPGEPTEPTATPRTGLRSLRSTPGTSTR